MTANRLESIIASIIGALHGIAELDPDDEVSLPNPGASPEAIAHAEQVRGTTLHPAYAEFLRLHDGWPDFPWGMHLFGTAELGGEAYEWADDVRGYSLEDDDHDIPAEVVNATIVGKSDHDATMVLLLDSGEVVDFRYQETGRYADFTAFLAERCADLRNYLDGQRQMRADIEDEWRADRRAEREAALLAELRAGLAEPDPVPAAEPPPAKDPEPASVRAADLVIMAGAKKRAKAAGGKAKGKKGGKAGKVRAAAALSLELYLGSYPSPEEVLACFRAFRRHFPVRGKLTWGLPARFYISTTSTDNPDDESWAGKVDVDSSGLFGIRLVVKAPGGDRKRQYILNVCGIPPTDEGTPRASFCEVVVPPDEEPERLAALARDLTDLLPVRSGHGGYSAYVYGKERHYHDVFAWCRRFFGLGVGYVDGWLEAAETRVVGASWLTVLGPTFTQVLGGGAPRFAAPEIAVDHGPGGLVIRAGAEPTLGDVQRGEFPTAVAEVERYLRPLKVTGWHRVSTMMMSGQWFQTTQQELPGFAGHQMTGAWLDRLVDPQRFLDPSPRERAEVLLARLTDEHGGDRLAQWRRECAEDGGYFHSLLRLLFGASIDGHGTDDSVAALELITSFPDDAPKEAFNNLLHAYLNRGELDKALAYLPTALEIAPKNPYIFHNAACVAARTGDPERALTLAEAAKQHGYEKFADMRTDDDLRALWSDPRFTRLFDDS